MPLFAMTLNGMLAQDIFDTRRPPRCRAWIPVETVRTVKGQNIPPLSRTMCKAVPHIFSSCGHTDRVAVKTRCEQYSWWRGCEVWVDDNVLPEQEILDLPYCRKCFSDVRRNMTMGFQRLEADVQRHGRREGLTQDQIERMQAELGEKLKKQLENFDRICLGNR